MRHLLLAALIGLPIAAPADEAEITGTWLLESQDEQGQAHRSILRVKREGQALSAKLFGEAGDMAVTEPKFEGGQFTCTAAVNAPGGTAVSVRLKAEPKGDNLAGSGELQINGQPVTFLFTGKRAPEPTGKPADVAGTWSLESTNADTGVKEHSTLVIQPDGDKVKATITTKDGEFTFDPATYDGSQLTLVLKFESEGNQYTLKARAQTAGEQMIGVTTLELPGQPYPLPPFQGKRISKPETAK